MEGLDFSIGTRLHGNMAAIAAGRPAVLISHDGRTGELAKTMHLPHLSIKDLTSAATPQAALSKVAFDPAAFDNWRQKTAQTLCSHLTQVGLVPSAHLAALATPFPREDAA